MDELLQQQRLQVFAAILLLCFLGWVLLGAWILLTRRGRRSRSRTVTTAVFWALLLVGIGGLVDALLVEPDWLERTQVEVKTARLPTGSRLRVVHLSDLHVEGWTRALERLPDEVNALQPDLLVFTGDSLNSEAGLPVLHEVLSRIQTRSGRFAVQGNHDTYLWHGLDLFGGGVARELRGEPARTADGRAVLCGTPYDAPGRLAECLRTEPEGVRIAVYHTPDLVEDVAPLGPDLYLAGHTHGGQVRMPFYGAIITMSRFDKKYEMGLYTVGATSLFVSRGVGFEPGLPRIRFFCRPEIAVINLVGTGSLR